MAQVNEPVFQHQELNSKIWSKTPHDTLNLIIEHADKATLVSWFCTRSAFHNTSSALLWEEIHIDEEDLHTNFEWTRTRPLPLNARPENGGICDFLIRGAAHRNFHLTSETLPRDIAD